MRIEVETVEDTTPGIPPLIRIAHYEVSDYGADDTNNLVLYDPDGKQIAMFRHWTRACTLGLDDEPQPRPKRDSILDLEMADGSDETIRQRLKRILATLWGEGEEFSGKRPLGDSGWEWELLKPLQTAGLIHDVFDRDGYSLPEGNTTQEELGRKLIAEAIERMCQ